MTTLLIEPKTAPGGIACESDSIATVPLTEERAFAYWQQDIPPAYWRLSADDVTARIDAARHALGTRLILLGHHYQLEDIIAFADYRRASFKLALWAAEHADADYLGVCGVCLMTRAGC